MKKELEKYYEKLIRDKEKRLFSEVTVVEEKIDGKVREAIRIRSDEIREHETNEIPETLSALPFGDNEEMLGYTYIFYSGEDKEEQLKEEPLAELVARV